MIYCGNNESGNEMRQKKIKYLLYTYTIEVNAWINSKWK